jgi:hypothetical protein
VNTPGGEQPAEDDGATASGQSRQSVSRAPPAAITNMTPRPIASTPMNLVWPGFDETVTRQVPHYAESVG